MNLLNEWSIIGLGCAQNWVIFTIWRAMSFTHSSWSQGLHEIDLEYYNRRVFKNIPFQPKIKNLKKLKKLKIKKIKKN